MPIKENLFHGNTKDTKDNSDFYSKELKKYIKITQVETEFHGFKLFLLAEKLSKENTNQVNPFFRDKEGKLKTKTKLSFGEIQVSNEDLNLINSYYSFCKTNSPQAIMEKKDQISNEILDKIDHHENASQDILKKIMEESKKTGKTQPDKSTLLSYFGDSYNNDGVDFHKRTKDLWKNKIKTTKNAKLNKFLQDKDSPYNKYLAQAKPITTNFENYSKEIASSIDDVKHNLRREEITINGSKLAPNELQTLKNISMNINEKDLMSFMITEMFAASKVPSDNIRLLGFILENAGSKFLELYPSMNDTSFCVGQYQLSDNVVGIVEKKGVKYPGAAVQIQLALPEDKRIPTDIAKIQGKDHHKAAFMNMVYNLGLLIVRIRESKGLLNTLHANSSKKADLLKYFAIAHQNPEAAITTATKWLNDKGKHTLSDYANKNFSKDYAKRTDINSKMIAKL